MELSVLMVLALYVFGVALLVSSTLLGIVSLGILTLAVALESSGDSEEDLPHFDPDEEDYEECDGDCENCPFEDDCDENYEMIEVDWENVGNEDCLNCPLRKECEFAEVEGTEGDIL